jgi:hypothetical protein
MNVNYREFMEWTTGGKCEIVKYVPASDYETLRKRLARVEGALRAIINLPTYAMIDPFSDSVLKTSEVWSIITEALNE